MKKETCKIVKSCLMGKICNNFKEYFVINEHSMDTRNQNKLVKLPKSNWNLERNHLNFKELFQGNKLYNELPLIIRKCSNFFKSLLDQYFSPH